METGIDWEYVRLELSLAEPCYDELNDITTKEVFLGTVMTLVPSGKYYMPWACSNVTEEEAEKDREWWEAAEAEAEEHGLYITSNEGCATDIMVGQVI